MRWVLQNRLYSSKDRHGIKTAGRGAHVSPFLPFLVSSCMLKWWFLLKL